jgi:H+/Cl- antiporter ClcA
MANLVELFNYDFGNIFYFIGIVYGIISVFLTVLWVLMVLDLIKRNFSKNEKIAWFFVLFIMGSLGALFYYFIVKKKSKNLNDYSQTLNTISQDPNNSLKSFAKNTKSNDDEDSKNNLYHPSKIK